MFIYWIIGNVSKHFAENIRYETIQIIRTKGDET